MPFKSRAQRAFFYAVNPRMAKEWEEHTPKGKRLPKRVKKHSRRTSKKPRGMK